MPVSYSMEDLKTLKEVKGEQIPQNTKMTLLEGQSAEAYLAGYAAGAAGTPLPEETNEPSETLKVAGGTVEPLRLYIPWWP